MTARHSLHPVCAALSTVLVVACAGAPRSAASDVRDFAYSRTGDSLVVAVSARNRSADDVQRGLESAAARAGLQEACEPGTLQLRGESDVRLAADAVSYLAAPRRVAVVACRERPAVLSAADLRALRWIVGTWRGSGDGQSAFYERYRFVDDSTLLMEGFKDSTLAQVTETSRYELRGGRFANAGPADAAQWVAVRLTSGAITFAPVRRARNRFTWRPVSADEWSAHLEWPASNAAPARARTYRLVRWTPPTR